MGIEESALGIIGLALNEREGEVAAKYHAAGFADALGEAGGNRTNPGDRQDAERDAGNENAEAAQTAAQLAPGKSPGKAGGPSCRERRG
jgi:hypothetical protein